MKDSELVDITAEVRHKTEKGIALWDGEEDKDGKEVWRWMPKSVFNEHVQDNGDGTFSLPAWVATKYELL